MASGRAKPKQHPTEELSADYRTCWAKFIGGGYEPQPHHRSSARYAGLYIESGHSLNQNLNDNLNYSPSPESWRRIRSPLRDGIRCATILYRPMKVERWLKINPLCQPGERLWCRYMLRHRSRKGTSKVGWNMWFRDKQRISSRSRNWWPL